jgi:hypothetical protein
VSAFSVPLEDNEPDTYAADPRVWAQHVETIDRLIAENARLRDSLAKVKAAHDKARQILGADVETVEDAAQRVADERARARAILGAADGTWECDECDPGDVTGFAPRSYEEHLQHRVRVGHETVEDAAARVVRERDELMAAVAKLADQLAEAAAKIEAPFPAWAGAYRLIADEMRALTAGVS